MSMPPTANASRDALVAQKNPVARFASRAGTRCRARARALCYRRPVQPSSPRRGHGLELRPTAARLVTREGVVLGIVSPQRAGAASGWSWWTHQGSGMALSLPAALARVVTARDTS
jgi:hypothetical protein